MFSMRFLFSCTKKTDKGATFTYLFIFFIKSSKWYLQNYNNFIIFAIFYDSMYQWTEWICFLSNGMPNCTWLRLLRCVSVNTIQIRRTMNWLSSKYSTFIININWIAPILFRVNLCLEIRLLLAIQCWQWVLIQRKALNQKTEIKNEK